MSERAKKYWFMIYSVLALAGGSILWDLAIIKADWAFYPLPFYDQWNFLILDKGVAADLACLLIFVALVISWFVD